MAEEFFKGTRKHPDVSKKTRRAIMKEDRDKLKRTEAEERQAVSSKQSLMEKIARLDRKLGPNQGAVKERTRLKNALENKAIVEENRQKEVEAKKASKAQKSSKIENLISDKVKSFVKDVTEAAVQEALKNSKTDKKSKKKSNRN